MADLWERVNLLYPYPGAANIAPTAAFFALSEMCLAQQRSREEPAEDGSLVVRHPPPPAVAMTLHCLVRPEIARFADDAIHCAAYDGHSLVAALVEIHSSDVARFVREALTDDSDGPRNSLVSLRLVNVAHMAAMGGQTALLRTIRNVSPALTTMPDETNRQVLHYAAMAQLPYDALNALFEEISEAEAKPGRLKDTQGATPLHFAARWGTAAGVRVCLERRQQLAPGESMVEMQTRFDETPIHFAAESGDMAKMDLLLDTLRSEYRPGFDINVIIRRMITHTGASVVHSACRSPSIAMIDRCVAMFGGWSKVRQSGKHNGMLIKVAGRGSQPKVFEYVKNHTQALPTPPNDDGWTPVHSAAAVGNSRMLRYLTDTAGYDIYAVDNDGYTVLHSAVVSDSPSFFASVAELVNAATRARLYTDHGNLLSIAASRSNLPMLKYLVANGYGRLSESVLKDSQRSVLAVAARGASPRVFKWILDNGGGTLDDIDDTGRSISDYAKLNPTGSMTDYVAELMKDWAQQKTQHEQPPQGK